MISSTCRSQLRFGDSAGNSPSLFTSSKLCSTMLFGKKSQRKAGGGNKGGKSSGAKPRGQQQKQEKQSVKDARFDAATRQFMFTMVGLSKTLPDKSKEILKNINLSFYPGAKIGVVGLNGSGKSTMLKIMAGIDTEFDGTARPLPGASIGYLPQEPELEYETVQECVDSAVASSQKILDEYNELSMKLADPDISDDEMTKAMENMEKLNDKIEAGNLWELDRTVSRAMEALRLPPGDAKTAVLSGGEKRRVSLCMLLLSNHDMLLLDEPTNHLDQRVLNGWNSSWQSLRVPLSVSRTIVTSWKMSLSGFWNSIVARAFHSKATTRPGSKPRTIGSKQKRSSKVLLPRPWPLNSNGFGQIQKQRGTRARLV